MKRAIGLRAVLLVFAVAATARVAAANEAGYQAALAAAEAAEHEAAALKNRWTATEETLAAARAAAASGDFDGATEKAQLAQALARASIAQAKEQADAWKAAVIR